MRATLTPCEKEALSLSAAGLTSKEIAENCGVSKYTVDDHIANAMRKLGVRSRAAAVAQAFTRGLLKESG
jgi:DNA-binding CsgD family transcriptional regulator